MPNSAMVFLALAVAFIAIGISGQHAFTYLGIVFLVIAVLRWRRSRS